MTAGEICFSGSHVSAPLGGGLTLGEARQWLADEAAGLDSRECLALLRASRCPAWPYQRWNEAGVAWVEPPGVNDYPCERRGGYWQSVPDGPTLPPWMAGDVTPWAAALAALRRT